MKNPLILGVAPATLLLIVAFVGPLAILIAYSFGLQGFDVTAGLSLYADVLTDPFLRQTFWHTFLLAASVTIISLILGYPIARAIASASGLRRLVMLMMLVAPLLTNQVVRTIGWIILLSDQGLVNSALGAISPALQAEYLGSLTGIIIALVHIFLPFMILPMINTFENMPLHIHEASAAHGAHRIVTFFRVTLPLSAPGIAAGSTIVFLLTSASLVTPMILGQRRVWVVSTIIYQQIQITQWGTATALAMLLLVVSITIIVGMQRAQNHFTGRRPIRQRAHDQWSVGDLFTPLYAILNRMPEMRRLVAWASGVYKLLFFGFMLIPLLMVVKTSFDASGRIQAGFGGFTLKWFQEALSSREYLDSLLLSLGLGLAAVLVGLAISLVASYAIVRGHFRGRNAVFSFLLSPLTIPGVVLALGFILFFQFVDMNPSFWRLVVVHLVIILPYIVRTTVSGLEGIDEQLEEAAVTLGARSWTVFRRVITPALKSSIFAGGVFAFLISFDEVTVTVLVAGTRSVTLPVRMFAELQLGWSPALSAVSTLLIGLAIVVLFFVHKFMGISAFRNLGNK